MRGAHWFGGSELYDQRWPLETTQVQNQPYISNDILFRSNFDDTEQSNFFGNVLDRFWINSNGVGIIVKSDVPLFVSLNESKSNLLCFSADYANSPYPNPDSKIAALEYTVCKAKDVKEAHDLMIHEYLGFHQHTNLPNSDLMKGLTFTTAGKYRPQSRQGQLLKSSKNISDTIVELNANLKSQKIEKTFFEIEDPFSSAFGDFNFNDKYFSNAHQMLGYIREYHQEIIVTMTPFMSMNSRDFEKNSEKLLKDVQGQTPSLIKWYHGLTGVIDITNPDTLTWYHDQLKTMMKNYKINSFLFYGCETNFLPKVHKSFRHLVNPGTFITDYLTDASSLDNKKDNYKGTLIQSTCAYQTQRLSLYTSLARKQSDWSHQNGIKSVIPAVLTLGILGYPFVVPDIVGGLNYGSNITEPMTKPDKELYIRWLQLNMFLPVVKFSYTPWDYDQDVVAVFEKMLKFRMEKVVPLLVKGIRESEIKGMC